MVSHIYLEVIQMPLIEVRLVKKQYHKLNNGVIKKFVVRDCAVKKELDVPFDASLMACNSYKHEDKELVVLCFSPSEAKAVTCHT